MKLTNNETIKLLLFVAIEAIKYLSVFHLAIITVILNSQLSLQTSVAV